MAEVIFTTVHGSRLYGFAHAGSDYDTYTVTAATRGRLRQTVAPDGQDRVVADLDRFLELARSGSHQSVEALFSPVKEWRDTAAARRWRPLIEGTRITGGDVFEKYERTIRKFCHGDFKRRRHAVRLSMNLADLRANGRFNPRLTPEQIEEATRRATELSGGALAHMLGVARTAIKEPS